jgi:hypothetical protein
MDGKRFMNGPQYNGRRNSLEILSSYKCPEISVKETCVQAALPLSSLVVMDKSKRLL